MLILKFNYFFGCIIRILLKKSTFQPYTPLNLLGSLASDLITVNKSVTIVSQNCGKLRPIVVTYRHQSGFMERKSTVDNLVALGTRERSSKEEGKRRRRKEEERRRKEEEELWDAMDKLDKEGNERDW